MYRLLLFVILLSIADAKWCRSAHCQNRRHHREHIRNPEAAFHKLAHQTTSTEQKRESFCRANMYMHVRETYDNDSYVLKYSVPAFTEMDFIVKVMHRLIYISAERWGPSGLQSFRDVNMLPDNLNLEEASWFLQEGELSIKFPYRTPLGTTVRKSCGNINHSYITIPMSPDKNKNSGTGNGANDGDHVLVIRRSK